MSKQTQSNTAKQVDPFSFMGDGMWDIFLGLSLFLFGLGMRGSDMNVGLYVALLWIPFQSAKRSITAPRVRALHREAAGRGRMRGGTAWIVLFLYVALLAALVAALALSGAAWFPKAAAAWLQDNLLATFGMMMAAAIGLTGALFGARRFLGYGALTLVAYWAAQRLEDGLPLAVMVLGGVIVLVGAALLVRFVRSHPLKRGTPSTEV
jgi:hypothetical protein